MLLLPISYLQKILHYFNPKSGLFLYIATHTRPDILYATNSMSRSAKSPTVADMEAVDRILVYLIGTAHLGLRLCSEDGIILSATVDASYASHC
jgi:hypothetical protein